MVRLHHALGQLEVDLRQLDVRWALIGGLAVNLRGEPRTTRDVDVTIAVEDARKEEAIVRDFLSRGYQVDSLIEHAKIDRNKGVRLRPPGKGARGILVDLLFALAGIEQEIVAAADLREVVPGLTVPVATMGHLLALKTLAGRLKDLPDFPLLLPFATASDLQEAREALDLIARRGVAGVEDRDLQAEFAAHLEKNSQA
jgi:hypothetical protein